MDMNSITILMPEVILAKFLSQKTYSVQFLQPICSGQGQKKLILNVSNSEIARDL